MSEKLITIKEFALNNNCPECYSNNGLHLTFRQKFVENKFYKSITDDVTHEIVCKTCNTPIYPVRWGNDIERVFEYHQKALEPKKTTLKLKKLAWIIILAILVLIVTSAILILTKV